MEPTSHQNAGLTRTEVFVLTAILALLMALITPAILSFRQFALAQECTSNLWQISIALSNYHDVHQQFPYGCLGSSELPIEKRWSWYLHLRTFVESSGEPIWDLDRPWDDPSIRPLRQSYKNGPEPFPSPPYVDCPSGTNKTAFDGQALTDYVGLGGLGSNGPFLSRLNPHAGMWAYDKVTRLRDCMDGVSNTLTLIETGRNNGCWLAGGSATVRPYDPFGEEPIGRDRQFGGIHSGFTMIVYVDGHVWSLDESTSPEVFHALVTINGGEKVARDP